MGYALLETGGHQHSESYTFRTSIFGKSLKRRRGSAKALAAGQTCAPSKAGIAPDIERQGIYLKFM